MDISIVTGQILGVVAAAIFGLALNRILRIEYTITCLLAGVVAGILIPIFGLDSGIRAHSLQDLVFFIILPILIFEAAWHIKPTVLKRWIIPVLLLATIGVLLSCVIAGAAVYFSINHVGFPWIAALLTGAILAATDPIAIINQLKVLKAPEDLATLIEGESLFNDATAIVLFGVLLAVANGNVETSQDGLLSMVSMTFFGGLILGAICGLVAAIAVLFLMSKASANLVLVFTAFGSFYLAEAIFHFSGIMSVMSAALVSRTLLKEQEQTFLQGTEDTWGWLGLLLNSVLFVIMGIVINFTMLLDQWLAIIIAVVATLAARAAAVACCGFMTKPLTYSISSGWQIILTWGGLRGAIAIALVLSLPSSLPYIWTIQAMVFGVVLFTLLVQGPTSPALIKRYS